MTGYEWQTDEDGADRRLGKTTDWPRRQKIVRFVRFQKRHIWWLWISRDRFGGERSGPTRETGEPLADVVFWAVMFSEPRATLARSRLRRERGLGNGQAQRLRGCARHVFDTNCGWVGW